MGYVGQGELILIAQEEDLPVLVWQSLQRHVQGLPIAFRNEATVQVR